jgi:hypothetical protein
VVNALFLLFKLGVYIEKKLFCRQRLPCSFSLKAVYTNGNGDAGNRILRADGGFPCSILAISYLTFVAA